jgi:anti-sigma B factor antagonist
MPIEYRPDGITLAQLAPDPQYTADLDALARLTFPRPAAVVLDFGAVTYVNSSNLAKLLRLRKQLIEIDGRLVLCGMTPQVNSVFSVTGLDKIFNITATVEEALQKVPL